MENKAIVLTDSINTDIVYADGSHPRCTTFDLTFWRALLAEFNTHQMIVKSSASSRAIPFEKNLSKVKDEDTSFYPMKYQKDHSGMQGTEYFTNEDRFSIYATDDAGAVDYLRHIWDEAKEYAIASASVLNSYGLTKQLCNRLLEPFMWHEVLATATEYENFFALRASEYAEIHFADLAYKMLDAYNLSIPQELKGGMYHLPYGDQIGREKLTELCMTHTIPVIHAKLMISTARCARKSYKTLGDNPVIDYSKDITMHDNLAKNGHVAPFAHPNRAMNKGEYFNHLKEFVLDKENYLSYYKNNLRFIESGHTAVRNNLKGEYIITEYGWCKQMRGFIPYRAMIPNENRVDNRVIRK